MGDKDTLAAKFRAAAARTEAEARRKQEEADRAKKARDTLFTDFAAFAEAVGMIACKPSETGVLLTRGERSIRFDRGEGTDVLVRLSDRDLTARYAADKWWLGDGPTAKELWDDGLTWLLVNWLDMPNPGAPEPSAPPPVAYSTATAQKADLGPKVTSTAKETAANADTPTSSRKVGQTFPGSRLQELKNPWD